jgi:predicted DNA-binding protein YlxM (UPF0122 family)
MPAKVILTSAQLSHIKELFDQDLGARKIAEQLSISRWSVQQGYKELGIYDIGRKTPRFVYKFTEKTCKTCGLIKLVDQFRKRIKGTRISYESSCLDCDSIKDNKRLKDRAKRLRQTDPNFVIRRSVSYFIWNGLKANGSTKGGESCLSYLGYSIDELRAHLESQFEPWMTWDNHGNYDKKTWDDNVPATWTWQIDHIIPHSKFQYTSMEDQAFLDCWALSNLRPYSAKQNIIDGNRVIK